MPARSSACRLGRAGRFGQQAPGSCEQRLWNWLELPPAPPVGAELPPVGAWPPPVADGVVVVLGELPPVAALVPPASPAEPVVVDELVPVVLPASLDDVSADPESLLELVSLESVESPVDESAPVPAVVPVGDVVPVAAPADEFSSLTSAAEAVGSERFGTVLGTGSETDAPPHPVKTSPPRRAPRSAAGRASLTGNASLRLGPCVARRSDNR
jgi:hypothetical protein